MKIFPIFILKLNGYQVLQYESFMDQFLEWSHRNKAIYQKYEVWTIKFVQTKQAKRHISQRR